MSGRLEREPTEVGQAYVICSLCVSHTHAHTQAQSRKKKLVWGRLSYLSCDASYSSLQLTESLAFRSHSFYQDVCAESALEIIYGFKNTDMVHSFGVILLNLFWDLLIHPNALSWMWRQSVVCRGVFCVCVCVGWLTWWWLVLERGDWTELIPLHEFIHDHVAPSL